MKNSKLTTMLLALLIIIVTSCSDESTYPRDGLTSLRVDVSSALVRLGETLTLTAMDQNGKDLTSVTTFFIDGVAITGSSFTPEVTGPIVASGSYQNYGESISVDVIENITSITLSVDVSSIKPDGVEIVNVTAVDQNSFDITSLVSLTINNELTIERSFTTKTLQGITFNATYFDVTSNSTSVASVLSPTALTLTASANPVNAHFDASNTVTFAVVDEVGFDVTEFVTFWVDGVELREILADGTTGEWTNEWKTAVPGTYNFTATFDIDASTTITSNSLPVIAN